MTAVTTTAPMPFTARDPHHNGACEWGWDGTVLWHRQRGEKRWVKVNRTHPTPKRIAVLAELMAKRPHWAADILS